MKQPKLANGEISAASLLIKEWHFGEAEPLLRRAIKREPDRSDVRVLLGDTLARLGRFNEAIIQYEKAISLEKRQTQAYLGIVQAKFVNRSDASLMDDINSLLNDRSLGDADKLRLQYALGKACNDLGLYSEAMHHFDKANDIGARQLRLSGRIVNRTLHSANVDQLIRIFSEEFFLRNSGLGSDSELPIFIVGMIRSGTTLVEQIISNHRLVGAGGELAFWGQQRAALIKLSESKLSRQEAERLTNDYCQLLRSKAPRSVHVTDKMPTNFFLLGLIHQIFPRAHIIHCRRNAIDTCLSIYMTPYGNLPDFACDRGNIVYYYEEYMRLMEHWRRMLPADRFHEVDYEKLVEDPDSVTRQMIASCGLQWDDSCLKPQSNPSAIGTPSSWQARQPIYSRSVSQWQRYEEHLGEFRSLLGKP